MQFCYFYRENGTATAAKDFDVAATFFLEQVVHVFTEFHVASLVGGYGSTLCLFLDGTVYDFCC